MTSDQIVYQQRVRVLAHSRETGNVAATCRTFGISRKTFYKWRNTAEQYGLAALWPKKRRRPMMPNATPTHVVETLLTIAVTTPTLGCRQYGDRLAAQGFDVSKSTVQNLLVARLGDCPEDSADTRPLPRTPGGAPSGRLAHCGHA